MFPKRYYIPPQTTASDFDLFFEFVESLTFIYWYWVTSTLGTIPPTISTKASVLNIFAISLIWHNTNLVTTFTVKLFEISYFNQNCSVYSTSNVVIEKDVFDLALTVKIVFFKKPTFLTSTTKYFNWDFLIERFRRCVMESKNVTCYLFQYLIGKLKHGKYI